MRQDPGSLVIAPVAAGTMADALVTACARIATAEPRGLHRLYVALTRAVSRLTVLHAQPLPGSLR